MTSSERSVRPGTNRGRESGIERRARRAGCAEARAAAASAGPMNCAAGPRVIGTSAHAIAARTASPASPSGLEPQAITASRFSSSVASRSRTSRAPGPKIRCRSDSASATKCRECRSRSARTAAGSARSRSRRSPISRTGWNMEMRVPNGVSAVRRRDLSRRDWTASMARGASANAARSITASAASRKNPPWNTEACSKALRSQSASSPQVHSSAPTSVWRRLAPEPEGTSSRCRRRSRSATIRSSGRSRRRAAASSSASGMPSSPAQISATAAAFAAPSANAGSASRARSTNRRTASIRSSSCSDAGRDAPARPPRAGAASGPTGNSRSPAM